MKDKKNTIIYLTLIVIIIFLLGIIGYIKLKDGDNSSLKVPTGNVDIFEIECDKNCDCSNDNKNDNVTDDEKTKDENDTPVFGEDDKFSVSDNDVTWNTTNELRIFENPMYENRLIIAPSSTNIYQFVIKNNTIYNIEYNMIFTEENKENINMKYRLLKNKDYVVGNEDKWVSYTELSQSNIRVSSKESDTYYLEWKWFDTENDTEIGEKGNVTYSLKINLKAEQDNG